MFPYPVLIRWCARVTTGDHLLRTLSHRHLWPIAGMDLMLVAGAAIAALVALRIRRRPAVGRRPSMTEKQHA